jgi:hypothetical protein
LPDDPFEDDPDVSFGVALSSPGLDTTTKDKSLDNEADADATFNMDSSTSNAILSSSTDVSPEVRNEIVCLIKSLSVYVTILINLSLDENYAELNRYIDTIVSILDGLRHLLS